MKKPSDELRILLLVELFSKLSKKDQEAIIDEIISILSSI